jgi:type IV secretory pathway VirJ component
LIGRIVAECLVEQEKVNAQLSQESKVIKPNFALAQSANLDLEKKVAELVQTLKRCQDERKVFEEDAENSRKELERLQKTHDDDLRMIENLRRDHDRSLKTIEDLRANNSDLAKSLSVKDRRVLDLEKALAEQKEASKKNVSDLLNKLKLLLENTRNL